MKKISFKLFIITCFTGIFFSCANLDINDDGRTTMENIFSSYLTTRNYYRSFAIPDIGLTYQNSALASYCDEAQDASDGVSSQISNWYNNMTSPSYNPLTASFDPYSHCFEQIRRTGVFLKNIANADFEVNEDEKQGWMATMHVLRAYYYLQLIKRYGGVPIIESPYSLDHDYSKDRRASFEECVDFILSECDVALSTPEPLSQNTGFRWRVSANERGVVTRAFTYAVKSQAALFAASPLWYVSGSKYTWEKVASITKEALDECLAHGYELYNREIDVTVAPNPYTYYFIQRSDPDRSIDKETIYESNAMTNIWAYCGTPITNGQVKAGACPSQELVDSYEMANGQPPILGYTDANHLNTVVNPASGYDPANPYVNRDPRFYGSIFYNGALRTYGGMDYPIELSTGWEENITSEMIDDYLKIVTTSFNTPFIIQTIDENDHRTAPKVLLTFEYKSNRTCPLAFLFFMDASFTSTNMSYSVPHAPDWTRFELDVTSHFKQRIVAHLAFRVWMAPDDGNGPYEICLRNMKLFVGSDTQFVETFIGGNCGISNRTTDVRYTRTGYYMRKFNHNLSNTSLRADGYMKLFRLGELYLNFAEAAYQAYGPDAPVQSVSGGAALTAREAVNIVRKRASMPSLNTMSKEDFEKRYRNERRIELAFEEHRFFDVRRWKILDQTDDFVTGMRIVKNADNTFTYQRFKLPSRGTNTYKYLMYPIKQEEVVKMQELTGQSWQNPGW